MKTRERRQGVVLVHTGEGKGKSSSAFGMVFRAAGWGMKVCVIQFIKGQWQTGEQKAAERFDNIEWHALGDGFTWNTKNPEQDIKTSREIWEFSKQKILSGEFDLVLLDEINYLWDVLGGTWIGGYSADIEHVDAPKEAAGVLLCELLYRFTRLSRISDSLIVDVGDIHYHCNYALTKIKENR